MIISCAGSWCVSLWLLSLIVFILNILMFSYILYFDFIIMLFLLKYNVISKLSRWMRGEFIMSVSFNCFQFFLFMYFRVCVLFWGFFSLAFLFVLVFPWHIVYYNIFMILSQCWWLSCIRLYDCIYNLCVMLIKFHILFIICCGVIVCGNDSSNEYKVHAKYVSSFVMWNSRVICVRKEW